MTVTQLQQDLVWAQPCENRRRSEAQLLAAPKSDLYVLPEMWTTGFATEPEGIAESGSEPESLLWMRDMAARLDAALCGSIAIKADDGTHRNRLFFVTPGGTTTFYDKRHLFTYGGEHLRYTPGTRRVVAEWRGWRFLLQVCYDLRFPCFSRNRLLTSSPVGSASPVAAPSAGADYDAVIYVASWPESRIEPWRALLRARAIENQAYVIAVNRTGDDPACHYCGGTELIDPYGRCLAACADNTVSSITTRLDREALLAFRAKFPVLSDAD